MRRPRWLSEEDGAAAVEFALIVPVLLLLFWGVIELGRMFYTVANLSYAAREAARYGAVASQLASQSPYGCTLTGAQADTLRDIVERAFQPLGPPLDRANDIILAVGRDTVRVELSYDYAPIVPLAFTMPMARYAVFRCERAP